LNILFRIRLRAKAEEASNNRISLCLLEVRRGSAAGNRLHGGERVVEITNAPALKAYSFAAAMKSRRGSGFPF